MKTRITLTGNKEIDKLLENLPKDLSEKVITDAHKTNARLLLNEAKRLVPVDEGGVQKSLAIVTEKKGVEKGTVYVGPRKKKPWEGWRSHLIEFGVAPHTIKIDSKKVLSDKSQVFGKEIQHPGSPAQPFMRPAFDATIKPMLAGIRLHLARALKRNMKKYIKNTTK